MIKEVKSILGLLNVKEKFYGALKSPKYLLFKALKYKV